LLGLPCGEPVTVGMLITGACMPDLEQLAAGISVCLACELSGTRTQSVPGEGLPSAQVFLLGEGPGYYEDKSGRPFVGAAGKFLDELIALAGLRRDEVFITNVVKCRPPNNRDPQDQEIAACCDWLDQQLEVIRPKVIVTLGRFSMSRYFPGASISRIHGQAQEVGPYTVVPMFHPAAALHQARYRQLIEEDFRRLPEILAQRTAKAPATAIPPPPPELPRQEEPSQMRLL
jgi:uracil-DNA glycosylase